jgi:uncharacterized membrane protein
MLKIPKEEEILYKHTPSKKEFRNAWKKSVSLRYIFIVSFVIAMILSTLFSILFWDLL